MTTQPLSMVTTTWHQQPRGILSSCQTRSFQPPPTVVTCQGQSTLPSRTSQEVKPRLTSSRRGRRSIVPPEQREQTRRIKKQNMERRRRACISGKMDALHSLALQIIGFNPEEQQLLKVEKADILNTCHRVLEGVSTIAKTNPNLQNSLKQLRSNIASSFKAPDFDHTVRQISSTSSTSSYSHPKADDDKENLPYPNLFQSHASTPKLQRIPAPRLPLAQLQPNFHSQSIQSRQFATPSFQDSGIGCDSFIQRYASPSDNSRDRSSHSLCYTQTSNPVNNSQQGIPRLRITTNPHPNCQQVVASYPTSPVSSYSNHLPNPLASSAFHPVQPISTSRPQTRHLSNHSVPVIEQSSTTVSRNDTTNVPRQSPSKPNVWRPYL